MTAFPIGQHIWEVLVSDHDLDRILEYIQDLKFNIIKPPHILRRGFFIRALILWLQSKDPEDLEMNPFLKDAASIYETLLHQHQYKRQQILMDIAGVIYFLPKSAIMGFYLYRRNWLHFVLED